MDVIKAELRELDKREFFKRDFPGLREETLATLHTLYKSTRAHLDSLRQAATTPRRRGSQFRGSVSSAASGAGGAGGGAPSLRRKSSFLSTIVSPRNAHLLGDMAPESPRRSSRTGGRASVTSRTTGNHSDRSENDRAAPNVTQSARQPPRTNKPHVRTPRKIKLRMGGVAAEGDKVPKPPDSATGSRRGISSATSTRSRKSRASSAHASRASSRRSGGSWSSSSSSSSDGEAFDSDCLSSSSSCLSSSSALSSSSTSSSSVAEHGHHRVAHRAKPAKRSRWKPLGPLVSGGALLLDPFDYDNFEVADEHREYDSDDFVVTSGSEAELSGGDSDDAKRATASTTEADSDTASSHSSRRGSKQPRIHSNVASQHVDGNGERVETARERRDRHRRMKRSAMRERRRRKRQQQRLLAKLQHRVAPATTIQVGAIADAMARIERVQEFVQQTFGQLTVDDKPSDVDVDVWHRLLIRRKHRLELEVEVRVRMLTLREREEQLQSLANEVRLLVHKLRPMRARLSELNRLRSRAKLNSTVLMMLQQGIVEIEQSPVVTDLSQSVMLDRVHLHELNDAVRASGRECVGVLRETSNFRKGINMLQWRAMELELNLQDAEDVTKEVQLMRVTKSLQSAIKHGGHQHKQAAETEVMERKLEWLKSLNEEELRLKKRDYSKIMRKVRVLLQENEALAIQFQSLREGVKQRDLILHNKTADSEQQLQLQQQQLVSSGDQQQQHVPLEKQLKAKRFKMLHHISRLKDIAKAQTEDIALLTEERDRLRKRTFPHFHDVSASKRNGSQSSRVAASSSGSSSSTRTDGRRGKHPVSARRAKQPQHGGDGDDSAATHLPLLITSAGTPRPPQPQRH
eukprot:TRINITY_DN67718_c7_g7_i1.p1 TRINITY_DN67718_c7_g7~~TRINITY_DN67718_c7_g7_i1.p1  ORF type:complete len:859 (-),score=453.58 TRINITY_DN67718_c7_g7_i1:119-2695(-)